MALGVCMLLAAAGCQDGLFMTGASPNQQQQTRSPGAAPAGEVFRVVPMFVPPYWQSFDARNDPNPEGFRFNLFLLSRKNGKGIHTDGVIRGWMYRLDRLPDGSHDRVEVCNWVHDLTDIARTTKAYELGWGYQPMWYWGDADVLGRDIEIAIEYAAPDGRTIRAQPISLKVPAKR